MTAIRIVNAPRPSHEFNFGVIGAGERHPNLQRSETEVRVRIQVGIERNGLLYRAPEIDCVVDTGATVSFFSGDLADELDLELPQHGVYCNGVELAFGTTDLAFVCQLVGVRIGCSEFIEIPACFPVEWNGGRYVWKHLRESILGMEGVLDRRVLCFTPEALFVFCRTKFPLTP